MLWPGPPANDEESSRLNTDHCQQHGDGEQGMADVTTLAILHRQHMDNDQTQGSISEPVEPLPPDRTEAAQ